MHRCLGLKSLSQRKKLAMPPLDIQRSKLAKTMVANVRF
jgi:hypothetical protein